MSHKHDESVTNTTFKWVLQPNKVTERRYSEITYHCSCGQYMRVRRHAMSQTRPVKK